MALIEVKVPDIGDFKDVAVKLLVLGDSAPAGAEPSRCESDKASMEIPSSAAGVVKELKVKIGDTVNEGSPLLLLEGERCSRSGPAAPPVAAPAAAFCSRPCAQPLWRQ